MSSVGPARARLAAVAVPTVAVPLAAVATALTLQLGSDSPAVAGAGLAERFAPILRLSIGEEFRPIDRRGYVASSELRVVRRWKRLRIPLPPKHQPVDAHPSASSLPDRPPSCPRAFVDCHYYLKVVGGDPRRGTAAYALAQDQLTHLGYRTTVYWHYDERHATLQYWFFYAFNDFVNRHEGDWEQITLLLGPSPHYEPLEVGYSSHRSGEAKLWKQIPLGDGRSGDHLLVYVARGSHANYFDPRPHRVFRHCPKLVPHCLERNGGDGEELDPGMYELVRINWRPYVGDYGPGNYIPRVGRWALATHKLTVRDPPDRRTLDWANPPCWLSRTRPADDLVVADRQELQQANKSICPSAKPRKEAP